MLRKLLDTQQAAVTLTFTPLVLGTHPFHKATLLTTGPKQVAEHQPESTETDQLRTSVPCPPAPCPSPVKVRKPLELKAKVPV